MTPEDGEITEHYATEGLMREMLNHFPNVKLSSIDAQIVSKTLYEELWGIHDHKNDPNPLSQVLLHDNENLYTKNNLIEMRLKIYIETEIQRHTGMTFAEYLSLPRHYQTIITRVCDEEKIKKNKKNAQLKDDLDEMLKDA